MAVSSLVVDGLATAASFAHKPFYAQNTRYAPKTPSMRNFNDMRKNFAHIK
jgi:hypothetical protein